MMMNLGRYLHRPSSNSRSMSAQCTFLVNSSNRSTLHRSISRYYIIRWLWGVIKIRILSMVSYKFHMILQGVFFYSGMLWARPIPFCEFALFVVLSLFKGGSQNFCWFIDFVTNLFPAHYIVRNYYYLHFQGWVNTLILHSDESTNQHLGC